MSLFHHLVANKADEIIHNRSPVKPFAPWNPPWPIDSPAAQPCGKCTSMTATCEGLRSLFSPDGYAHHEFSGLEASANDGCPLCGLLCTTLSRGQLYEQDSKGEFALLRSYNGIKTVLSASYAKTTPRDDGAQPLMIRLNNLTVEWLHNNRKCRYNIPGQASRTVELQIFTDEKEPELRQSVEVGGECIDLLYSLS
jgi:hypothetical protein